MSNTGADKERGFINHVRDNTKWDAMKAPASGSATKDSLPDAVASRPGMPVVNTEIKYTGYSEVDEEPIKVKYIPKKEVDALKEWSDGFGGIPVITTRWWRDTTFYHATPDMLYDAGKSLRVKRSQRTHHFTTLEDVVEYAEEEGYV